jgi:hypothetical protein
MSTAGGARHPHAETDVHAEHIPEMVELDRDECLHLLAATNFGRLAVNAPGWPPVIPPVTYLFRRSPTGRPAFFGARRQASLAAYPRRRRIGPAHRQLARSGSDAVGVLWQDLQVSGGDHLPSEHR